MLGSRNFSGAQKITLLASLYFAQGLPFGFFHRAVPVLLREAGFSLASIGASSLLALPWALKFLWAPLVDRHGSRRAWILSLQALAVLLLLALAFVPPALAMHGMLVAFFFANLVAATQDIATDGLALDMLSHDERGLANGVQVGGYRLGMILGGGGLLVAFSALGWMKSFVLMAALLAASTLPLLLSRRLPAHEPHAPKATGGFHRFFMRPSAWAIIAIIALYKIGDSLGTAMIAPFLTDQHVSMSEQGWMLGTVGSIAGMTGALTGGALISRIGRRMALGAFGLMQALPFFGYAFAATFTVSHRALYALAFVEHFGSGMATAALFTCMMDWCEPGSATDYTVQASIVVIAGGAFSALSGALAQHVGYALHFGAAAIISLLCVGTAAVLFPRTQRTEPTLAP